MELIGIIWFISWIGTIIVAAQKGGASQGCIAVFTGFFLGPIAFIWALLYKGHTCPFCKERVQKDASVCPHCQKEIGGMIVK